MTKLLTLLFAFFFVMPTLNAAELAVSALEVRPLLLGTKAPDSMAKSLDGKAVSLTSILNNKPAILVFYRGGWCPYCNVQLSELRAVNAEAKKLGYQVIAISPDRPEELKRTLEKNTLDYTLISDQSANLMQAFGIGYTVDTATLEKLTGYGIDLEKASGEKHHALPVPSVFIIDAQGSLQFSYVHPDYSIRLPGSVILSAAKSISMRQHQVKPKR